MGRSVHATGRITCQSNETCSELGGGNRARSRSCSSLTARGRGDVRCFSVVAGRRCRGGRDAGGSASGESNRVTGLLGIASSVRRIGLGGVVLARSVEPLLRFLDAFFRAFVECPQPPLALPHPFVYPTRLFRSRAHTGILPAPVASNEPLYSDVFCAASRETWRGLHTKV